MSWLGCHSSVALRGIHARKLRTLTVLCVIVNSLLLPCGYVCDPLARHGLHILLVCHGTAPNDAAIDMLTARSPLVEIGAGTGYWARSLRERGAEITAYDLNPPAPDSEVLNSFHGRLPAFTEVKRGGPKAASGSKHSLFLCYPPPGDKMALNCLRRYR